MELTMRLLVSPALLFAALLLPSSTTTSQALEGIPSLSSLRGIGNGRQPLSREEELVKALQFLEEYERNLGDTWVGDDDEEDWQPNGYPLQREDMIDENIVPWEEDQDVETGYNGEYNLFLRNLLQGVNKNRNNAVMPNGYNYTPQRSSSNNQYVLFSPVDQEADLEDEITLDIAIEKLKAKQKEQQLWEDIIGDMLAEEILEMDAREEIQELMDVKEEEEELDEILEDGEDTIFEEEDPWTGIESSEAEESDVVPWSWASPEWEADNEGAVSSSIAEGEFDTDSSSEEENEIEQEAAALFLEEMLAEEADKQRQEEEQEKILEMVLGDNSEEEDDEEEDDLYDSATEEAIENYYKALMENTANDKAIFGDGSEEELDEEEESESEEEPEAWWGESSSAPEAMVDVGEEIIQEYGIPPEEDENEEYDYNQLVQEITNEIEAAAEEVEEEVVAALKDRLVEENMKYLTEEEDEEELEEPNASNEINDVDAAQILANMLANYQQQQKRTSLPSCPIRSLVDDCAFIDRFSDVDSDGRYRNLFQKACNRHQLCYTCGGQFDIETTLCDEVFDAEMLADCGEDQECIETADQFSFVAINTHTRAPTSPPQCKAKCLLPFLIKD